MTATVAPTTATATYQWYADGVAITGATSATYKLTVAELGKVITVKATAGGKTVESTATAKVVATTVTASKITGMTGDANSDKTMDTPIVGDTLKVETTPAVESGLTYQWKANGTAIVGATKAEYPVVASDAGKAISCTITGSDGVTVNAAAANPAIANVVKANIASVAQINLQKDDAATSTLNESYPILGDAYAITVTDKTSSTNKAFTNGTEYTVKWYLDSVSDANELAAADITNATNDSITPVAAKASKLVGHKLVVVVSGAGSYMGSVQAETPVVQVDATDLTVTVYKEDGTTAVSNSDKAVVGENLTAKATLAADAKYTPTVSYQWYYAYGKAGAKTIGSGANYSMSQTEAEKIVADTSAASDFAGVIVTGSGNVQGKNSMTSVLTGATGSATVDAKVPTMAVSISNSSEAAEGVTLKAAVSPSAYDSSSYVTYAWYKADPTANAGITDANGVLKASAKKVGISSTFTVPAGEATDTDKGEGWYYVVISAVDATKAKVAAVATDTTDTTVKTTYTTSTALVKVGTPINASTVTTKAVKSSSDTTELTSNFTTGNVLSVSVKDGASALGTTNDYTVNWYKNKVTDPADADHYLDNKATYTITDDNVFDGDTIYAVIVGKGTYSGQKVAATTYKAQYYGESPAITANAAAPAVGSDTTTVVVTAPSLGAGNTYNANAETFSWYRLSKAQYDSLSATNNLGQGLSAAEKLAIVKAATAIDGATKATYKATEADKDFYLACVVTAPGYQTSAVWTTTTAVTL